MSVLRFQGERLRLARLFHGLTQIELGETVAASRQYIHQLETGGKSPSEEMWNALAEALDVEPYFFSRSPHMEIKEEQCHFRKLRTTPVAITRQALAHGTFLDELVSWIDKRLELPSVNFPDFEVSNFNDVEHAAESCRIHWGLKLDAPITHMTRVLENAGAIVTHFEGISDKVDALSMSRPRPIVVRSTLKESACRMRFDLAHECGHLVMHKGIETGDHETEAQANAFASALLMPRIAFCKEFPRSRYLDWKAIFDLKLRWKVAARAIIRRAHDLGLIDAITYRKANIHLTKTGQAKFEKYDDIIKLEQPETLALSLTMIQKGYSFSIQDICKSLSIRTGFFEKLTGKPDFADNISTNTVSNIVPFAPN